MPIVGTAGHVDHGKSTLVQALTGRDPDRWAEEKERGLTIDLGFAWTRLDDETEVGFVDVPGHERFIKNMLAGVGALDVALFVVAADEGWMPQSEEHLSVLDLLEIRHGVVAITRIDLVDDDLLELAILDVDEHIAGTSLADWPIVPVSSVSGAGLDSLRTSLAAALRAVGPPIDVGRPRLWVDRAFVISGAGAVVTGTLSGGTLHRDDEIAMWPGPRTARIRGIQSHEHEVAAAGPGTRTAINLVGLDAAELPRGTLLARPGLLAPTGRLLVDLRIVRSADAPVTGRGAYHLHAGTGSWPVDVRIVGADEIATSGTALVSLPERLAFEMGDRVILREVGRRAVVAGGRVLDPAPSGKLAHIADSVDGLRAVIDESPDRRAATLLELRGIERKAMLAAHTGGGRPDGAVEAGAIVASRARARDVNRRAVALAAAYEEANPLRPGIPKAEVASTLGIESFLLDAVVASSDELVDAGASVHTEGFAGGWGPRQDAEYQRICEALRDDGLAVRRASQLELDGETFHAMVRNGRLIRVDTDLVYLPEQIEAITQALGTIEDEFTVARFRDALGLSRRQAVPLLEWLDTQGWTSRRGDVRVVRRRPGPESSGAPTR